LLLTETCILTTSAKI